jgi:hypothetical protein
VTPEDDQCQIRYASSRVPRKARQAFSEVATEAIRNVSGCASRHLNEQQTAQHEFAVLPSRVLHASTGSPRRGSNVLGSIRQYRGDLQVAPELSADRRNNLERGIAQRVHMNLQRGNLSCAARASESSEVADPTPVVLDKLETVSFLRTLRSACAPNKESFGKQSAGEKVLGGPGALCAPEERKF